MDADILFTIIAVVVSIIAVVIRASKKAANNDQNKQPASNKGLLKSFEELLSDDYTPPPRPVDDPGDHFEEEKEMPVEKIDTPKSEVESAIPIYDNYTGVEGESVIDDDLSNAEFENHYRNKDIPVVELDFVEDTGLARKAFIYSEIFNRKY